jgi:hypothetical protein
MSHTSAVASQKSSPPRASSKKRGKAEVSPTNRKKAAESKSKANQDRREPAGKSTRNAQKAEAFAGPVLAPLLGPKLDVPTFGSLFPHPAPSASSGLDISSGMQKPNPQEAGVKEPVGEGEATNHWLMDAASSVKPRRKGFSFNPNLPKFLQSEDGKRYRVKDFYTKSRLALELFGKMKSEEALSKFEEIMGPLRPVDRKGNLGEPIDYRSFLDELEEAASEKSKTDASNYVKSMYLDVGPDGGAEKTANLGAVSGNGRWVDFDALRKTVLEEVLRSEPGKLQSSLEPVYADLKKALGLEGSEDDTVTAHSREPGVEFPISFRKFFDEVIRKNASSALSFTSVPIALVNRYVEEAREMGLEGPPRIPLEELDKQRVKALLVSGNPPTIGTVDLVGPNDRFFQQFLKAINLIALLERKTNRVSPAMPRRFDDHSLMAESEREKHSVSQPTPRRFDQFRYDFFPHLFKLLGFKADPRGIREWRSFLENSADALVLKQPDGALIGQLKPKDWLELFGLPLPPEAQRIIEVREQAPERVKGIHRLKGPGFVVDDAYAKALTDAIHENASDSAAIDSLIEKANAAEESAPDIFKALKALKLRAPTDTVRLIKEKGPEERVQFGQLIRYLRQGGSLRPFDKDRFDAFVGDAKSAEPGRPSFRYERVSPGG